MRPALRFAMLALSVLAALGMISAAHARCQTGEVKLRFAQGADQQEAAGQSVRGRLARLLSSTINAELQGRACVEILKDATRYDGLLVVNALTGNEADLAAIDLANLAALEPGFQVLGLPLAFRNLRAVDRFAVSPPMKALSASIKKAGLLGLGVVHGGFFQLSGKRPVINPSDVLGLRFRRASGDASGLGNALRTVAQTVADADLVAAMGDGRVEVQSNTWVALGRGQHGKIHDGVTVTNHAYFGTLLTVSERFWDAQSPNLRRDLMGIFDRLVRQTNFETARRERAAKRFVVRSGVPVRALTRAQRLRWRAAVQSVWDVFQAPNKEALLTAVELANRGP
ncbi:MAG: TRAP transporter substrate-binding protein DctP [Pseudomonadota bacterium]